jgi:plastocyanin domain-containing protein
VRIANGWVLRIVPAAFAAAVVLAIAAAGCGGARASRVEVAVTENGFEPDQIAARVGQPVTLVVTRKTDMTCAKEIVFAEQGIEKELPLNQAVEVTVTPTKAGELSFACGMNMVTGKLIVR